ncbi:MAG TPA: hypothetical protein VK484_07160, partial [Ferruginibacter sp.]|nr:hypothetical protein [Ferruginibacter sp.]
TDLVCTTIKIQVTAQMMGQEMNYDSEKKDNTGPLAETLDKMAGKIKNITIDDAGRVIKEDKDETEKEISSLFGGMSGSNLSLFKLTLIGREFKTGATWAETVSDDTEKMKMKTTGNYTISSVDKETHTAVVLFTGMQTGSGTIEQMGQEMGITTSNKIDDRLEVDLNTGILSRSSSNINGTSNVDAAGMVIPATTKSETVTTIKRLN